jgi:hypothetical protein
MSAVGNSRDQMWGAFRDRGQLRTTSAAKAARARADKAVRTFKPGLDGVTRCVDCGVVFGEKHRPDCRPVQVEDRDGDLAH